MTDAERLADLYRPLDCPRCRVCHPHAYSCPHAVFKIDDRIGVSWEEYETYLVQQYGANVLLEAYRIANPDMPE